MLEFQKLEALKILIQSKGHKSNSYTSGAFNSEIKRILCQTKGFIGRQGLSRNLLPS